MVSLDVFCGLWLGHGAIFGMTMSEGGRAVWERDIIRLGVLELHKTGVTEAQEAGPNGCVDNK